ncbi:MAG: efflux RND transporter periplasmic adaptor subunit [Xanthomonadales bacterium]|nr:efflux RND transporter periplasmic adaptor subunit [Xanthomonadales bacterium]
MDASELVKELRLPRETARPDGGKGWLLAIAAGVLALIGAGAWYAFGRGDGTPPVETVLARPAGGAQASRSVLDATGYVTPRRIATVSAKVTGKVIEVLIEEGMEVEEGQLLARLDDAEVLRDQALSEASLQAARTDRQETQVRLDLAERELARQTELVERKLTSAQAVDAARADRDALRARLGSAQAQVTVAARRLEQVGQQLDNTLIRAPFSGVVIAKAAQPGEMISPISAGGGFTRTGIGTIVDMGSLEIEVDVSESYINRVVAGQPVESRLNAYPDWTIPGRVIAVIPTADRSKATVKVRVSIDSRDPRIVPDMGVRVAFLREAEAGESSAPTLSGVRVPASAVRGDGAQASVFLIAEGRANARSVRLGERLGEDWQVLDGLQVGDRVARQQSGLSDGQAVTLD